MKRAARTIINTRPLSGRRIPRGISLMAIPPLWDVEALPDLPPPPPLDEQLFEWNPELNQFRQEEPGAGA
jgi:hypothetical protein